MVHNYILSVKSDLQCSGIDIQYRALLKKTSISLFFNLIIVTRHLIVKYFNLFYVAGKINSQLQVKYIYSCSN